jgi:diadenosine tetraphosphate (Ap4A) HIT family hydrolase
MDCPLCERLKLLQVSAYPYLIHEFEHSWLLLGEHQFFKGYSVLLSKVHYREVTDMPPEVSAGFFQEALVSHRALEKSFSPTKMNMCSLGNVVAHVHWHFFPRYANDPGFKDPPWLRMHLFDSVTVNSKERDSVINLIRSNIY